MMGITLELYLDHQIIRGELRVNEGQRPIDVLNAVKDNIIEVTDAWSVSLHAEAPPTRLDRVRVRRPSVLVAIVRNATRMPPRSVRVAFVEKRPIQMEVGLGPYAASGTFYVSGRENVSSREVESPLLGLEHDADGRFFLPFTQACLRSQYSPRWKVDADLMLVNRAAISYSYLLPAV
jgi:hypothetical protein